MARLRPMFAPMFAHYHHRTKPLHFGNHDQGLGHQTFKYASKDAQIIERFKLNF